MESGQHKSRRMSCWACRTTVEVPKLNGEWVSEFKCGWCGAITALKPISSKGRHGLLLPSPKACCTHRSLNCLALLSQWGAVIFVLCLLSTVMSVGILGLLPNTFTSPISLFWSQLLAIFLSSNIVINYLFAAFLSSKSSSNRLPEIQGGTIPKGVYENYKYCVICQSVKAPGVHHCSICNVCIEDMDHHCPFIGNCVGRGNLRNFLLFLFWTAVGAIYAMVVCIILVIKSFPLIQSQSKKHRTSLWNWSPLFTNVLPWWSLASFYILTISMAGGIGVAILLSTQLYQIWKGQTYIDQLKGQLTSQKNESGLTRFARVFGGKNPFFWLFPCSASTEMHQKNDSKIR